MIDDMESYVLKLVVLSCAIISLLADRWSKDIRSLPVVVRTHVLIIWRNRLLYEVICLLVCCNQRFLSSLSMLLFPRIDLLVCRRCRISTSLSDWNIVHDGCPVFFT